uniref:Uncharacterized protein n=1 Tax=Arundo donax TaxID=35708 RepID=A0A0A8YXA7_ARUDO
MLPQCFCQQHSVLRVLHLHALSPLQAAAISSEFARVPSHAEL